MYKTIKVIFYLFISSAFLACAETLDDIPAGEEVVNGFRVVWRKNVTEMQKDAIRQILDDMQFVEGGIFLMGATLEQAKYARENEKPAHYVQLSNYYIGRNEISISQLESIIANNFSDYERNGGAPRYLWEDWKNIIDLIFDLSGVKFDFPTEAQWEYAARGGKKSNGFIYPGGNTLNTSQIVENELGLFGMAGDHSEWCKDAYNDYSGLPLETDPYVMQGLGHIVRGGNETSVEYLKDYNSTRTQKNKFSSVYKDVRSCRVSARSYADDSSSYIGVYISCRFVINITQK